MTVKRLAIPSKENQLLLVGTKDTFKVSRVQRLSLNKDIPDTTVDELGNRAHVGSSKDLPNVTLTFSLMDVGIEVFSVLTGTSMSTAYPSNGVDISNLGQVDAIIFVKDSVLEDYVKTGHAGKLQIRDFTFNFSVDGESTEDYTAVGSKKRWFTNDVIADKIITGGTSLTLTQTPIVLKNGKKLLSLIVDGSYLTEVASGPASGEFSVSGTTVTLGAAMVTQALAVYQAAPAGTNWADVNDTLVPAAIKGRDVGIKIMANQIPRVQSITINGTLNVQPVKEMGNTDIVGYQRQVPDVTGTLTVLDTDTELISLLQYGVTVSGTEYYPGDNNPASPVTILIEFRNPVDDVTVKKSVYLDSIGITSDGYTSNVNQNASQTFNFKSLTAHCVVYSGAKP